MAGSLVRAATLSLALIALTACQEAAPEETSDSVETPEIGVCRVLTPDDVAGAANNSDPVDCTEEHTAETYAVGPLPDTFADADHDDERLGGFAFKTCSKAFIKFLGGDESMALRTLLSWAWFRPSEDAWAKGARWYRCDLIGGNEDATEYFALPETGQGLFSSGIPDDEWMQCVNGDAVPGAPRIPCSEPHNWRAVTTIKVGQPKDKYPGDRLVEVTSRDYCSSSVSAWLDYPLTYTFAYTWFHEAEWETGNRRSICWARTDQ